VIVRRVGVALPYAWRSRAQHPRKVSARLDARQCADHSPEKQCRRPTGCSRQGYPFPGFRSDAGW